MGSSGSVLANKDEYLAQQRAAGKDNAEIFDTFMREQQSEPEKQDRAGYSLEEPARKDDSLQKRAPLDDSASARGRHHVMPPLARPKKNVAAKPSAAPPSHTRNRRKREMLRRGSQYANADSNYILMHQESDASATPRAASTEGIPEIHRQCLEAAFKLFDFAHHELLSHLDTVLVHLNKTELEAGDTLVNQGDEADDVFIVVAGELEVEVSGVYVSTLKPGTLLGELAILMGERRTATVFARVPATVYSLSRKMFLRLQAAASSHSLVQRTTWLQHASVMKRVSAFNITKIATIMETVQYETGHVILSEGEETDCIYLLEAGTVRVSVQEANVAKDDFNNQLVIEIPDDDALRRQSVMIRPDDEEFGENRNNAPEAKISLDEFVSNAEFTAQTLVKGTVIGQAVVMVGAFAGKQAVGAWAPVPGKPLHAFSPATFICSSAVTLGRISTKVIVENVGELQPLLTGSLKQKHARYESAAVGANSKPKVPSNLQLSDLRNLGMLGQGSFGIVSMVQLVKSEESGVYFALKTISKSRAVEGEQVEHILNESSILKSLEHHFILQLHSTFQDEHNLYFLTDALPSIELWSLIYEDASGLVGSNPGLPVSAATFYAANICEVFCYIHLNNVAYRDLKPENLMVDNKGYLVLIDFGFAKRVPWVEKMPDGEQIYHARTFTMCGTPEYIAPELILNQGHDHSVDLWAIGCIIFEMLAGHTPFQDVDGSMDYSDIFTGILSLKSKPLAFPPSIKKSKERRGLSHLIVNLMQFESPTRIGTTYLLERQDNHGLILNCSSGNRAGHYNDIFEAPAFKEFEFAALREKRVEVPWIPSSFVPKAMPEQETLEYDGDQRLFEGF